MIVFENRVFVEQFAEPILETLASDSFDRAVRSCNTGVFGVQHHRQCSPVKLSSLKIGFYLQDIHWHVCVHV